MFLYFISYKCILLNQWKKTISENEFKTYALQFESYSSFNNVKFECSKCVFMYYIVFHSEWIFKVLCQGFVHLFAWPELWNTSKFILKSVFSWVGCENDEEKANCKRSFYAIDFRNYYYVMLPTQKLREKNEVEIHSVLKTVLRASFENYSVLLWLNCFENSGSVNLPDEIYIQIYACMAWCTLTYRLFLVTKRERSQ